MIYILNQVVHILSKCLKKALRNIYTKYNTKPNGTEGTIDIVIPLVIKDIMIAQECVISLRKYSINPIRNIYIVSPNHKEIKEFCLLNSLIFIDENTILPINNDEIKKIITNKNKIGWFTQQLIKLNSNNIEGITEKYLVFDADTILQQMQFFFNDQYTILKFSDEFNFIYRKTNHTILKKYNIKPISFIAHHMIIDKEILKKLKDEISFSHQQQWYYVILKYAVLNNYFFSEYELYAQFALDKYPDLYKIQYWFNLNENLKNYPVFKDSETFYQSVSFHNYER